MTAPAAVDAPCACDEPHDLTDFAPPAEDFSQPADNVASSDGDFAPPADDDDDAHTALPRDDAPIWKSRRSLRSWEVIDVNDPRGLDYLLTLIARGEGELDDLADRAGMSVAGIARLIAQPENFSTLRKLVQLNEIHDAAVWRSLQRSAMWNLSTLSSDKMPEYDGHLKLWDFRRKVSRDVMRIKVQAPSAFTPQRRRGRRKHAGRKTKANGRHGSPRQNGAAMQNGAPVRNGAVTHNGAAARNGALTHNGAAARNGAVMQNGATTNNRTAASADAATRIHTTIGPDRTLAEEPRISLKSEIDRAGETDPSGAITPTGTDAPVQAATRNGAAGGHDRLVADGPRISRKSEIVPGITADDRLGFDDDRGSGCSCGCSHAQRRDCSCGSVDDIASGESAPPI